MHITSKGQVTIPAKIRGKMALFPYTEVEFYIENDELKLRKKHSGKKGVKVLQKMISKTIIKMTTDEIMDLTRGE